VARKSGSDLGGKCYVGDDKRLLPENAAISLALTMALKAEDGTRIVVRETGTQGAIAYAERVGPDVITRRVR
jgi:hypothetical protein